MADEPTTILDASGTLVPVLTDGVTTRNGQPVLDGLGQPVAAGVAPRAQISKLATGPDGHADDVGPTNPLPTADYSPPMVQLAAGGVTVTGGAAAVQALPATPGRARALVQHTGTSGILWVRFDGGSAAAGIGEAVSPGNQWSEWTASAVSVFFEGTGTCRVATSELAAG